MFPDPRPYFSDIEDPRRETKNKLHPLSDILMIVLCSTLSGVEDWANMEEFALEKEAWFRQFLQLPCGIPSHDTLGDVMGRINPEQFSNAFMAWTSVVLPDFEEEQICFDGKSLRGSRDGAKKAVHLVSAFAAKARLVLAQKAVPEKTNEIKAIPEILAMLDIKGALVSIDAMGCQKDIAQIIVEKEADYLLSLKENHRDLCRDITLWLDHQAEKLPVHETVEKDHGRLEIRQYILSDQLSWLDQKKTGKA